MALRKYIPSGNATPINIKSLSFSNKEIGKANEADLQRRPTEADVDIDLREVYFLIMHFLSAGPCHRTYGQFWNELLEHQLLPRRYHSWYSRSGLPSGNENDDGISFPLSYNKLVERHPHVEKDHLVKLLKQLLLGAVAHTQDVIGENIVNAASVPTLLGTGSFSLLASDHNGRENKSRHPPSYMRWPHKLTGQVHGLGLREIGGGFTRHHRAPSIRAACYAIAKPSTMVQKMQNLKSVRGHRNAVYCAIFDRSGRYVITGSDDRLVKIWSMETAYCLASCRGHEGDITDLAVNVNNTLIASASNDCIIRVWRLPDGLPISVLRGHTGAVTAIAFSPRPGAFYQLLSSSDDGTCRIWDARYSNTAPRTYSPKPPEPLAGRNNVPTSSITQQTHQIFCCAFNASGTVFVTGSSDTLARVWNACKPSTDDSEQPNHEIDVLSGHENDVNYVQFSGCAVAARFSSSDTSKEDALPKFKNTWFNHDNIVTCSRDGSAIIWMPRSRRSHGKAGRWIRAYHLKVPPPQISPQAPRGGPRQRVLPTPRGVNMIAWSLDNRFVLAAIMDCRICVWNAVDGSLVHSLTGHTDSTYVLDVHPFNPRIAMSAGYDGKTILWDIWEGTPIRTYEIGPFKLVDGKFSSDGTSIILSDDVGQLYILSTGQGESQRDAKYDQFFLGDYRPLIHDTHGNVLDQETQLAPYRRNMQDLLCDSGMIPYPEPYQSTYQQRRLGALGIEWRPSSLRFAVGPDFTLDPDFQMLPIADLETLIVPLPEFVDAMDWEPPVEIRSDDNDSEYNMAEDDSSGWEQASLNLDSDELESSSENSEVEDLLRDDRRRSKRKKQKVKVEIMTSSGRRVKRRNLDQSDDSSIRNNRTRKSRNGKKAKRKKSSSKSRPQRAAARNALHLFSRITGASADGDINGSDRNSSESESALQDSSFESEESDASLPIEWYENLKGKEISLDHAVSTEQTHPESHLPGNRKKLILKLPNRDSTKFASQQNVGLNGQYAVASSSSRNFQEVNINKYSEEDCHDVGVDGHNGKRSHMDLLRGCKDGSITWVGARSRTSKRLKIGESSASGLFSRSGPVRHHEIHTENTANDLSTFPEDNSSQHPNIGIQGHEGSLEDKKEITCEVSAPGSPERAENVEGRLALHEVNDGGASSSQCHEVCNGSTVPSVACINETENGLKLKENGVQIPTKLRIKSSSLSRDIDNKPSSLSMDINNDPRKAIAEDTAMPCESKDAENNLDLPVSGDDKKDIPYSENKDQYGGLGSDGLLINGSSSKSELEDSPKLDSTKRMFTAVYRRQKPSRGRSNPEGDSGSMGPSTSNTGNLNEIEVPRECIRKARSIRVRSTARDLASSVGNFTFMEPHDNSEDTSNDVAKASPSRGEDNSSGDWKSLPRNSTRLRSTRGKRSSNYTRGNSPPRKSNQTGRSSWLMLSAHEEGSRYIPQRGDDVVYLRQGHQEYIHHMHVRNPGPWETIRRNIRAVEFCKVEKLEYATLPGSGESCCRMTLKFVDPTSDVDGQSFNLTLPEISGFPDFLVEKSRYDASMARNWTSRSKCQVWWKNEGEEDGSWWEGRVVSIKAKSPEFPDSPWEKYAVKYRSEPGVHNHSPWELHDSCTDMEQPQIDERIRKTLINAFSKLEKSGYKSQDYYGVNKLKQASQKTKFINRFPVPLSLEVIESRLENNYYRSLDALKHDFEVMLSNAEAYSGKNVELSSKLRRLSDWFHKILAAL
ncbi:bromodomain and WD repeat-containing protein 1 isoform X1 [Salvia hispanica]|uniref:bromodomain and WD repeat-containing protein 1 isoform X1 n=1 Tax=Salvia hispanica TaxID=49212 RepID=UPI002009B3BF|nr:bromodomain and WD repeat-containing protein 1 isoform X1 [Salvia hispanica]XP_047947099.1 bromodomain and WD repeat-containing protein 1 isoform X1 [Salvia hispanica]